MIGHRFRGTGLILVAILSACLTGCGSTATGAGSTNGGSTGTSSALSGKVSVFAAASLKSTFTKLATEFERVHPGTKVALSFAGSSDLVTQIIAGAPADVFASADAANMDRLVTASLIDGAPANFATNVLTIAVPSANPASVHSFADLAKPGVKVVICASQVPCGAAAKTVEAATGTTLKPVSEESSVTDVLGKVAAGEADAGLVYVTDIRDAGGKVKGIPFDAAAKAVNTYPIATVEGSKNKRLAAAFTALVKGSTGQRILASAGFGKP
ncbi:molybdate ABC transporter substrate-binding protein [Paenarthrobacter sp. Z7-10]|uniref:molybdate ABC transporter substrate-binding protein n=1 Tax=Paenarthrobacter sp. Z7-10 TaxID=2787635 RepID=UPI0022A92DFB|nr:molybdate ABC transporter substrate-binding protein [Paenarthrobacter sp. Z7-10]MCZ2404679.1 molybdate ABC transporter substrate-binding protein [Paenarthrobacter sp. Z7-10]